VRLCVDVLFDDGLRPDFVSFFDQVVVKKKQLLRVELDMMSRKCLTLQLYLDFCFYQAVRIWA
jgi:hypothetical protein